MVGKWFWYLVALLIAYIAFWTFQQNHPSLRPISGTTKLILACNYGDYDAAKKLIEGGASVSEIGLMPLDSSPPSREPDYTAPLDQAVYASAEAEWFYMASRDSKQKKRVQRSLQLVQYLIDRHAKPYRGDNRSPLVFSAIHPRAFRTLELLLQNGYDPMVRNSEGETPLHQMSTQGQAPDTFDKSYSAAMWFNHVRTLQVLLRNGCPVDVLDYEGRTPLHYASRGGCITMVRVLLAFGADPHHKDAGGMTPIDVALDQATYDMLTGKTDWTEIPELNGY